MPGPAFQAWLPVRGRARHSPAHRHARCQSPRARSVPLSPDAPPPADAPHSLDDVFPLVYDELRRLARSHLDRERPDISLQPTELVHEAYMRLVGQRTVDWTNRAHFFGIAAQMMRRILVNHARAHNTDKRGGGANTITLGNAAEVGFEPRVDLVLLDEALTGLTALDQRQGRIVELRFFGGLSVAETADVLAISPVTVKREWATARLWLRREMQQA